MSFVTGVDGVSEPRFEVLPDDLTVDGLQVIRDKVARLDYPFSFGRGLSESTLAAIALSIERSPESFYSRPLGHYDRASRE